MIDLSPSFFLLRTPSDLERLLSLLLSLRPLSLPLGRRAFPSPRLACRPSGRAAGRVFRAVGRCGWACRSSLVLHVGWRNGGAAGCLPAFLISALSSVCGSLCVPRLVAQCGWRVACPAWLVPVNRRGRRNGVPLLAWMRRTGECVDYVERPFIG